MGDEILLSLRGEVPPPPVSPSQRGTAQGGALHRTLLQRVPESAPPRIVLRAASMAKFGVCAGDTILVRKPVRDEPSSPAGPRDGIACVAWPCAWMPAGNCAVMPETAAMELGLGLDSPGQAPQQSLEQVTAAAKKDDAKTTLPPPPPPSSSLLPGSAKKGGKKKKSSKKGKETDTPSGDKGGTPTAAASPRRDPRGGGDQSVKVCILANQCVVGASQIAPATSLVVTVGPPLVFSDDPHTCGSGGLSLIRSCPACAHGQRPDPLGDSLLSDGPHGWAAKLVTQWTVGREFTLPTCTRLLRAGGVLYRVTVRADVGGTGDGDGVLLARVTGETAVRVALGTAPLRNDANPATNPDRQALAEKKSATPTAPIGGLDAEITALLAIIRPALQSPEAFARLGVAPPRGVLLHGPPGTGKTLVARHIARTLGAHVVEIGPDALAGEYVGDAESALHAAFAGAGSRAPCIVFIDEADAVCPASRGSAALATGSAGTGRALELRFTQALAACMDDLPPRVVVLCATNRPSAVHPLVRSRLVRDVEIPVPSRDARLEVLRVHLAAVPCDLTEEELGAIADRTHGYVSADLALVVSQATLSAFRRADASASLPSTSSSPSPSPSPSSSSQAETTTTTTQTTPTPATTGSSGKVCVTDLRLALGKVGPSAMRSHARAVPKVTWGDVGGMSTLRQVLQEVVEWPVTKRDVFEKMGVRPPRGVLMHGPPGCSKTLVAKALANSASAGFVSVKGPELFSKWVGESEKAVAELFRVARVSAPTIVFFDEIDAIGGERGTTTSGVGDRVLSQLLAEMDGVEPSDGVIVLAATNRPDRLDKALLRPGRFDRLVFVGPPVGEEIRQVLDVYLDKVPLATDVDRDAVAHRLRGYTGAEIAAVCREAGLHALRTDAEAIGMADLLHAAGQVEPQVTDASLDIFREFCASSGRAVNTVPPMVFASRKASDEVQRNNILEREP